jgi:AAA+ ATPase superfamily predicted ATPase
MDSYAFPAAARFLNRTDDLAALERWWAGDDRNALNLYGRRRVGKSWLFRMFAHGKPAIVLVAERLAPGAQLSRLSAQLEDALGLRPQIEDVPALFRRLYALGKDTPCLVVLDEFPYLLPRADASREAMLTAIQAVIEEERDRSRTKLVLCGSHVAQMQALMSEGTALRGRMTTLMVDPMSFSEATAFIDASDNRERIERYAVTGGMARYLAELGSGGPLRELVCERLLDHNGALFNDPREVLEHELEQVATYFAVLQELAGGERALREIAAATGLRATSLSRPMDTLRAMRLVERRSPINATATDKASRYRIADPFLRFWFRFVFPFQEDLAAGLAPTDLYALEIELGLADHVAPVYEDLCRVWVRRHRGGNAARVASWWGPTTREGRAAGRYTEEIDIVGIGRSRATVIGECKWTTSPLSVSILAALENFKIPALRQSGVRTAPDTEIVLFCRSGFTDGLRAAADREPNLTLVELSDLVAST